RFNGSNGDTIDTIASLDSEGEYTCVASNHIATVRAKVYIRLVESPTIAEHPKYTMTTVGNPSGAEFHCVANGIPKPTITWRRVLGSGKSEKLNLTGEQLVISSPKLSDAGKYLCVAKNSRGTVWSNQARLRVMAARIAFPGAFLKLGYIKVNEGFNSTHTEYKRPLVYHKRKRPYIKWAIRKILRETEEPSLVVLHSLTCNANTDGGTINLQLRIGEYKSIDGKDYYDMQAVFKTWSNLLDGILKRFEELSDNEQILTKRTDVEIYYALDRSQFAATRKTKCPYGHELYPDDIWNMICVPCHRDTSFTLVGQRKWRCIRTLRRMKARNKVNSKSYAEGDDFDMAESIFDTL
ncbi:unnamed protein product, partial [Owenia fusiformis]